MKRRTAWMLAILLVAASVAAIIPMASALAATDYSIIKVKISNGTPASQAITVVGSFTLKEDTGFKVSAGAATITNNGGRLTITSGSSTKTIGTTITLVNGDTSTKANMIKMKGYNSTNNSYIGDMIFTATGGGVRAINMLPFEQYVIGVIAMEMGSGFPLEALKAQAVAARSYAAKYIEKRKNGEYHIVDGPTEQAYIGYTSNAKINQAVTETKGQMVVYDGSIIEAFYSANHGGQTDVAGNAFGGGDAKDKAYPFFTIADDPYDRKMAEKKGLIEKVFLPAQLKGNQGKTNSVIWGDIMAAFNLSRTASESGLSNARINSITPTRKYSRTAESKWYTAATLNVTVNGTTKNVTINLSNLLSRGVFSKSILRMTSFEEGTSSGVEGWYLTHQRFGHGVGLSQWGAYQMSDEGKSYKEILGYYYRNCALGTYDTSSSWASNGEDLSWQDENTEKSSGWQEREEGVYYYDEVTGAMAKNWKKINGSWYYFGSSGARQTGWLKLNGIWYHLDNENGAMAADTSREVDGSMYIFNANGAMQSNKWYKAGSEWYYLNGGGDSAKGWKKVGGIWYYFDRETARMVTGSHEIDGQIYLFNASGSMQANKWFKQGNDWYYLNSGGSAAKGWKKDKGIWYYLDNKTAKMQTGVNEIDGDVYVLRPSGAMVSNAWNKQGADWYYLNASGTAYKGWKKDKNIWYYMDAQTAKMHTGPVEVNGDIYVLSSSGAMASHGWKLSEGNWYYLKASGVAYKGWNDIGGKRYYFDPANGIMATGEKSIDGKIHVFSESGYLIETRDVEQPSASPVSVQSNDEASPVTTPDASPTPEPDAGSITTPESAEESGAKIIDIQLGIDDQTSGESTPEI